MRIKNVEEKILEIGDSLTKYECGIFIFKKV